MADLASLANRLDSSVWTGIGALGVLVFLVGIYEPALAGLPYPAILEVVLAVAGAALAVLGFSFASERRAAERKGARPTRPRPPGRNPIAPSLEVYDPRVAVEGPPPPDALPPGREP